MIEAELADLRQELPYNIFGNELVITDIDLSGDMIVCMAKASGEFAESIRSQEDCSSEQYIARMISNMGQEVISGLIKNGLGLEMVYESQDSNQTLLRIEVQPDKLKEVNNKLTNGEIKPYSLLELAEMELAEMEIPTQIDDGVWITDAYIQGNNVYYVGTFEFEVDKSNIYEEDIREMKESIIADLRGNHLIMAHEKEMVAENIHLVLLLSGKTQKSINTQPEA